MNIIKYIVDEIKDAKKNGNLAPWYIILRRLIFVFPFYVFLFLTCCCITLGWGFETAKDYWDMRP